MNMIFIVNNPVVTMKQFTQDLYCAEFANYELLSILCGQIFDK